MVSYHILDCPCLLVDNERELKQYIAENIFKLNGGYSVAINAEKIVMYTDNSTMHEIIDNALYRIPDGAGATLGMRFLHGKRSFKVNFPQIILEVAEACNLRILLVGATEDSNAAAAARISSLYPNVVIAGRMNGYFKEVAEIEALIQKAAPQVVLLALGSPKQEQIAAKLTTKYPQILLVGCGGALDVLAGKVKRAPAFFVNSNLEWLYRLIKQPKRYKRQFALLVYSSRLIKAIFKKISGINK